MTRNAHAILFDLDDTLYRERRFVISAYAALARAMEAGTGIPAARSFAVLIHALKTGRRSTALQSLCASMDWPQSIVPMLVDIIRSHRPRLRLPLPSRRVLALLRRDWQLGIVTNGPQAIQTAKVLALGIAPLVDTVVYATEHGSGRGKPDAEPFLVAAERLDVDPARCMFVGNDLQCDVAGARQVGMQAIWLRERGVDQRAILEAGPHAIISCVAELPRIAWTLLNEGRARCA